MVGQSTLDAPIVVRLHVPEPTKPLPGHRWYWINTGWGCGGIEANRRGVVINGAPIFRSLRGQTVEHLRGSYEIVEVK